MNKKLAVLSIMILLAGTGIGYAISMPEISKLQTENSTWTTRFNNLNTTHSHLKDDYSSLNNSHNEFLTQFNTLQGNYSSLNSTYYELTSELLALIGDHNYLNESYVDLSQQYGDLLFHYNLINGPASNFTTVEDLQITFTTHRTTYYYEDSISGNVTITYLNGTSFKGKIGIHIQPEFGNYGSFEWGTRFDVNGYGEFLIEPPYSFLYGPGVYTIYILKITTVDGYVIAGGPELDGTGVQVEAK